MRAFGEHLVGSVSGAGNLDLVVVISVLTLDVEISYINKIFIKKEK